MRIIELHLEVEDLQKSLELYKQILPHKRVEFFDGNKAVLLILEDGAAFGLWEKGQIGIHNGKAASHLHFAFDIKVEELQDYTNKLERLGLKVLEHSWGGGCDGKCVTDIFKS
jgi:catechol-2,3-dioxygenase